MSDKVVEVEFNDAQKTAMACALMAVAEEVANNATQEPLKHGDTIDLLSDTDSNSNCELLGTLYADANEPPSTALKVLPFQLKVQVKEECVSEVVPPATTSHLLDAAPTPVSAASSAAVLNKSDMYGTHASAQYAAPPFASSVLDGLESLPANTFVTLVDLGANELRVEECDTAGSFAFGARNGSTKDEANAVLPKLDTNAETFDRADVRLEAATDSVGDTTVVAGIYKVTEEQESLQTSAADSIVFGDTRTLAATFTTDQLEWSADDVNEGLLEPSTRDSDDAGGSMLIDDDIITLDGSGDDDDDEVVETKLISILESDSEASNDGQLKRRQPERRSIEMLVHYNCPECDMECGPLHKWKAHTDSAHDFSSVAKLNLETVISREGKLCYQCKVCGHKFKNDTNFAKLLKHRIMHMPYPCYFKCRLCDKRLKVLTSIKQHLRVVHAKICHQYTNTTMKYRKYIEFHCPVCNKILSNYVNWKDHLEESHNYNEQLATRVRPVRDSIVACQSCDKQFHKRSIAVHVMKHEPYRSFHCKVCKLHSNNALARCVGHVRQAHLQGCGRIYKCTYCEAQFDSVTDRNNHLKEKHQVQRVHCEVCQKSFATAAILIAHMNSKNHQKLK